MDRRMTDRLKSEANNSKTVISESTTIKGDLFAQENVFYSGQFEGSMELESLLVVEKTGKIKGKFKLGDLVVEGEVIGTPETEIEVKNKVEIRASGRIQGKLVCSSIAIEEGAIFQGDINMKDGADVQPTYFKEKREDLKNNAG